MDYLNNIHNTILNFLDTLGYKYMLHHITLSNMDITIRLNSTAYLEDKLKVDNIRSNFKNLNSINQNIKFELDSINYDSILELIVIYITYKSDYIFSSRETKELRVYGDISRTFGVYDIFRVYEMRELMNYYPFNVHSNEIFIFQRQVIKSLSQRELEFHIKLSNNIKDNEVSNQQQLVIFKNSGFIFYEGKDKKVKTLTFNER